MHSYERCAANSRFQSDCYLLFYFGSFCLPYWRASEEPPSIPPLNYHRRPVVQSFWWFMRCCSRQDWLKCRNSTSKFTAMKWVCYSLVWPHFLLLLSFTSGTLLIWISSPFFDIHDLIGTMCCFWSPQTAYTSRKALAFAYSSVASCHIWCRSEPTYATRTFQSLRSPQPLTSFVCVWLARPCWAAVAKRFVVWSAFVLG